MGASLHVANARIWTGDAARPWARSLHIVDGRVAGLDGAAVSPGLDAEGRTAAPGIIDAHMHLLDGGASLGELDLSGVRSRREFEDAIARRHAELPPGRWLLAGGWSTDRFADPRPPDKSWLAAAGTRPAVCRRMDLHAVLVNEPVLAQCDTSKEPRGGRIERAEAGAEPTGLMIEAAAWDLVLPKIPRPGAEERRAALRAAVEHLNALGVTAAGTMEHARTVREVIEPERRRLTLRCRVMLLDDPALDLDLAADDMLAVIGAKTFLDGSLGSRTARMLAPYSDDPGNRGMLLQHAADGTLREWARGVAAAGLAPVLHAIGDEAVREALRAIEGIDPAVRPRLEHVQHVNRADIRRFGGLIASMQPRHKAEDGCYLRRALGEERVAGAFAFRSLLTAGARLAFGSDWPVVTADPMLGIQAAVTGLTLDGQVIGAEETLSPREALVAYTSGAAWSVGLDDAGVLRPGALGDLVLFDTDPFRADWANHPPRIVTTIVGGRVVYDSR